MKESVPREDVGRTGGNKGGTIKVNNWMSKTDREKFG